MPSTLLSQFIAFPASMLLGGWLVFISHSNPASAKTVSGNQVLMAQAAVKALPPQNSGLLYVQQSLPQLQPASPSSVIEFRQPSYNRIAPSYQNNYQDYSRHYNRSYNQDYNRYYSEPGRYLVYVNGGNEQLLEQVRQIEPRAYIRQFQGRPVIQAGAFSREYNAQQRVRQLQSYGIYRAQLISYSNGGGSFDSPYRDGSYAQRNYYSPDRDGSYAQRSSYYAYGQRTTYSPDGDDSRRHKDRYYYVAIPAKSQELPEIESRIRQSLRLNTSAIAKNHPKGPLVAIGPFHQRLEAEQWNNYLHSQGFGNARVYYGR